MAWANTAAVITGDLITAAEWNQNRLNQEWLARDHWRAAMTNSNDQNIGNNLLTVVQYNSTIYDFGTLASTVNEDFTIPAFPAGITTALVAISGFVLWASNDTGKRELFLRRKNDGIFLAGSQDNAIDDSTDIIYWEGQVTTGQTFDMQVLQTSGATLALKGSATANWLNPPQFTIRWLAWQD